MVWVNGKMVESGSACVPISHEGVKWGVGAFETILSRKGQLIEFDAHIQRLQQGVSRMGYALSYTSAQLIAATQGLLDALNLHTEDARVRIITLRDYCVISAEVSKISNATCSAVISEYKRNASSPLAGIKSASYAADILARNAHPESDEVILFNHDEELAEGTLSNIFLVKNDTLLTPHLASGCLNGMMRQRVMRLAKRIEVPCVEGELYLNHLVEADEIFLTNSIKGVVGVTQLGEIMLSDGIGPLTQKLRKLEQETGNLLD